METKKISIVVAVLNKEKTLLRCIKSVFLQTYPNKELIILDGGSTDETLRIIKENSCYIKYWESSVDRGIYHAWNRGLSYATGEWICFLGADDFFLKTDVLEKMIPSLNMAQEKGIRLVYGSVASINKIGQVKKILGEPWKGRKSILSHRMPPHPGLLHHMSIFKELGNFDESFRIASDYELLLRELKTRSAIFVRDVITVGVEFGGMSCNIRNYIRLIIEDINARKKHGLNLITFQILRYYIFMLYNAIFY